MTINWPDRIKVIIFSLIIAPFVALIACLTLAFTGAFTVITLSQGALLAILLGVLVDGYYVIGQCRKIKQDELCDKLPNLKDINNISLPRTVLAISIIVLAITALVSYHFYSVTLSRILLGISVVISIVEILFINIKRK